jgi:uncharacterized membrane protein YkvA (DUF1232 family)
VRWRERAEALRLDVQTLALAARDERMPFLPKLVIGAVAAYLLSPLDLVPDAIPLLGQLDDLVILPLGIALAVRLTPPDVLAHARERVAAGERVTFRSGAVLVVLLWLLTVVLAWMLVARLR